jgi:glycosyltransferase involved in cell wall biosynthesis
MTAARRLHVSLSIHYTGVGFTSAAVALAQHMPAPFEPVLYVPQVQGPLPANLSHVRPFPPIFPKAIAYRARVEAWARRLNERNLFRAIQREGPGAIVWLWPGASIDLQRDLKTSGAVLIREMINCHVGTARRILDAEYGRLGLPPTHVNTEVKQRSEQEQLALADLIVSPSECVDASLREWGISEERIVRSTFGWSPNDFAGDSKTIIDRQQVKALFVGTVGVRKGIHLALAAWDRAKIEGVFLVVGPIESEIEPLLSRYRDRPDIRFVPFTHDLGSLYRAADFMFFPTLEEGAPLVCYQAGGCGLPILTSPMGQGRLIEHRVTGLVADPHDLDTLAQHIQSLASDAELRRLLSTNVRERAMTFDWTIAAEQRAGAFINHGL